MPFTPNLDAAWTHVINFSTPSNGDDNRAAMLGALIARRCPDFAPGNIAHIVNALQRLAESIKRYAEQDCNHGLTPRQEKTLEARKATFHAIATACGFASRTGGDPRGACAYLLDPEDESRGDGWGGGWAVYR